MCDLRRLPDQADCSAHASFFLSFPPLLFLVYVSLCGGLPSLFNCDFGLREREGVLATQSGRSLALINVSWPVGRRGAACRTLLTRVSREVSHER